MLEVDITEALKELQNNNQEVEVEILIDKLGLTATVIGWTEGEASGGIK